MKSVDAEGYVKQAQEVRTRLIAEGEALFKGNNFDALAGFLAGLVQAFAFICAHAYKDRALFEAYMEITREGFELYRLEVQEGKASEPGKIH